ncbi:hypothetical protein DFP73DRAFT_598731 [Morchella snyderi]|nr:hypothetical protein DFP73DRAFT_598731 [Morchella snyderi]
MPREFQDTSLTCCQPLTLLFRLCSLDPYAFVYSLHVTAGGGSPGGRGGPGDGDGCLGGRGGSAKEGRGGGGESGGSRGTRDGGGGSRGGVGGADGSSGEDH